MAALFAAIPVAAQATAPTAKQGRIYFVRDSDPGAPTEFDIHAIAANGSGLVNLTAGMTESDRGPAVDPTGRWIAYSSGGVDADIWVMRSNGTGHVEIVADATGSDFQPTFSPDGKRIVFVRDTAPGLGLETDLWAVNINGTGLTRLTATGDVEEFAPDFSPDGKRIVFDVFLPAASVEDIYSIAADGSDRRGLVTVADDDQLPVYSPDGRRIAFTRAPADQLQVTAADGTGIVNLTPTWVDEAYDAEWAPDGTRLVFDDDNGDLFTVSSAGGAISPLTNDATSDADPAWEHVFSCGGRRATIVGDDGPDKIKGTKKADVIVANAGKDLVRGLGGKDRICGGKGKDKLLGGGGRDLLRGGKGRDTERQ